MKTYNNQVISILFLLLNLNKLKDILGSVAADLLHFNATPNPLLLHHQEYVDHGKFSFYRLKPYLRDLKKNI